MQKSETLQSDYMLFESNFNGSWNEYIDAFHSVLSCKLNLVWVWSDNYPGSIPLTPFKRYIDHNQLYNDYYYIAYPGSSLQDIKNALALTRAFDELASALERRRFRPRRGPRSDGRQQPRIWPLRHSRRHPQT